MELQCLHMKGLLKMVKYFVVALMVLMLAVAFPRVSTFTLLISNQNLVLRIKLIIKLIKWND